MQENNQAELITTLFTIVNELSNKVEQLMKTSNKPVIEKEWLTMAEAAKIAGVSYNTFTKYRKNGLKVCEIDGVKRIKKSDLDNYFKKFM